MRTRLYQLTLVLVAGTSLATHADASLDRGALFAGSPGDEIVTQPDLKSRALGVPAIAIAKSTELRTRSVVPSLDPNRIRLAADLPVGRKAPPVEYVKVCSLYGAGFYYIPGTDTCVRIQPVKAGYNFPYWCFGDTGIGYTSTAYSGGAYTGGGNSPSTSAYGGIRVDQAWGTFSVSGDLHESQPKDGWSIGSAIEHYWTPALRSSLRIDQAWGGFSVSGGLQQTDTANPTNSTHTDHLTLYGDTFLKYGGLSTGGTGDGYFDKHQTGIGTGGYDFKPDFKIDLRENWGQFGLGDGSWGRYEKQPETKTSDTSYNWNSNLGLGGSLQYQVYTEFTKPQTEIIRHGLNYPFYDLPKTDNVTKIPAVTTGRYDWTGFYIGTGGPLWTGDQTGWGSIGQIPTILDPLTIPSLQLSRRSDRWNEIHANHFGKTYDIRLRNLDGTEDRYRGFFDDNGNYHERYDFYDYVYSGEDYRIDYVFDGGSTTLTRREETEWEEYGTHIDLEVYNKGQVQFFHNYVRYEDPWAQAAKFYSSNMAQIAQTYLNFLASQVVSRDPVPDVQSVAGDLSVPDVQSVAGDLGVRVQYDQYGGGYGYLGKAGITATPDAKVAMKIEQPAPASTPADSPKNRDSKGKGPGPVAKPATALKLFTNKPGLPIAGKPRPQNDFGFDQGPAECLTDPSGGCTITVAASERRFYGLAGSETDFNVGLKVPYTTAIVWREADGSQAPTTEAIRQRMPSLPPELRAKTRSFAIGDKKFTQAMIEASTFNPSPDRWKDYLRPATSTPAGKSKRGDKGGGPLDSFAQDSSAQSDDCEQKQPAAYVEGEPMAAGGTNARALPGATIHLKTAR